MTERDLPRKKTPRCPVCGRPRDARFRPFCSKRCRDVDLARWFNQVYAIPAADGEGQAGVEPPDEDQP
jgi:uncharacterized protein